MILPLAERKEQGLPAKFVVQKSVLHQLQPLQVVRVNPLAEGFASHFYLSHEKPLLSVDLSAFKQEWRPNACTKRDAEPILFRKHIAKHLFLSHFIFHAIIIVAPWSSTGISSLFSQEQYRSVHWCCNCICHELAARQCYKCQVYCSNFYLQGNAIIKHQFGIVLFSLERWHLCYLAVVRIVTLAWLLPAAAQCCAVQCCNSCGRHGKADGGCWDEAL